MKLPTSAAAAFLPGASRPGVDLVLGRLLVAPPGDDAAWLVDLVAALRPALGEPMSAVVARVDALAGRLEGDPGLARPVAEALFALLASRRQRHLLSETGVFREEGFVSALVRRVSHRVLPPAVDRGLWADLFGEIFSRSGDDEWVAEVPLPVWRRLFAAVIDAARASPAAAPGLARLRGETLEALRMLAHRLAALGVEPAFTRYATAPVEAESPFLAVAGELLAWCDRARGQPTLLGFERERLGATVARLDEVDAVLGEVRRRAHQQGASVALTTLLLRAGSSVARIRALLAVLTAADPAGASARLYVDLVRGTCRANGVRDLFAQTTELLALQVTENASRTGEHYVASTRAEYWAMARSAGGAGVVVGFMALNKLLLAKLHLAPFVEAFAFGLNYALGFVVVHLLHFTIATKQPAMTAATLAATLDAPREGGDGAARVAELTERITRTQLVAIAGNVGVAFPVSMAIAWIWQATTGEAVVDMTKAANLLRDSHPGASPALFHAAIAGVCLYLAGIVSGYYDNHCVYARIPDRIRALPWLRRRLGADRARRLGDYVEDNLGAIAGNIAFGFMLGFVGFFGMVLGLPLDIRHVTFSGANFGYGLVGLGFSVAPSVLAVTALGVAGVGLTNLAVSFGLALFTALRSRGLSMRRVADVLGALRARLRSRPGAFVFPGPDR